MSDQKSNEIVRSFLMHFDSSHDGIATYLSNMIDQYGVDVFYTEFKNAFANAKSGLENNSLLEFLMYLFRMSDYIPGNQDDKLKDKLENDRGLKDSIEARYLQTKNHFVRANIIALFREISGYFDEGRKNRILFEIEKIDPFLIQYVLNYALVNDDLEKYAKHFAKSENRYIVWGLVDFLIDSADPILDDLLPLISLADDLVIKERLDFYKKSLAVKEKLWEEGRIDPDEEEQKILQSGIFRFEEYYSSAFNDEEEVKDSSELEAALKRLFFKKR